MDLCYCSAQRSPASFTRCECHRFLTTSNQVGAEYRTDSHGCTGALEIDGSIHSVRVGARQRSKAPPGSRFGERIRAGDAESEGKMGVNVEVDVHKKREQ
jgi:hypothetical protein